MEAIDFLLRWIHLVTGVAWLGMLYTFELVHRPVFAAEVGAELRSSVTRALLPQALWWFRFAAMFALLSGLLILMQKLGHGTPLGSGYMTRILTGALLATVMFANMWALILPGQRAVIADAERVAAGGAADPAAAARGVRSGLVSRTNAALSVPMLFFMGSASHFPMITGDGGPAGYWIAALVVVLLLEANALIGPGAATQKPLATVRGTAQLGVGATLVLTLLMVALT